MAGPWNSPGRYPPRGRGFLGAAEDKAASLLSFGDAAFDGIEDRRLRGVLSWRRGERYRGVVHLDWLSLVLPLLGVAVSLLAFALLPLLASVPLLAAGHGVVVARRVRDQTPGFAVAGSELVAAVVLWRVAGSQVLAAAVLVYIAAWSMLAVVGWRVDMLVSTTHRRILRTRGLFLLKRTTPVPLDSVRAAPFAGPFLGRGTVTVDSVSTEDELLHNFGLVRNPSEVSAWVLRERDWALGRSTDSMGSLLEE